MDAMGTPLPHRITPRRDGAGSMLCGIKCVRDACARLELAKPLAVSELRDGRDGYPPSPITHWRATRRGARSCWKGDEESAAYVMPARGLRDARIAQAATAQEVA